MSCSCFSSHLCFSHIHIIVSLMVVSLMVVALMVWLLSWLFLSWYFNAIVVSILQGPIMNVFFEDWTVFLVESLSQRVSIYIYIYLIIL